MSIWMVKYTYSKKQGASCHYRRVLVYEGAQVCYSGEGGKSFLLTHPFSTNVSMFCTKMRIKLFVDAYCIKTVDAWWLICWYLHLWSLFRSCLVFLSGTGSTGFLAQGHLVRGSQARHRRFLVMARLSGFMRTHTTILEVGHPGIACEQPISCACYAWLHSSAWGALVGG